MERGFIVRFFNCDIFFVNIDYNVIKNRCISYFLNLFQIDENQD